MLNTEDAGYQDYAAGAAGRIKEALDTIPRGGRQPLLDRCIDRNGKRGITPQAITGWIKNGRVNRFNLAVLSDITGYRLEYLISNELPKFKADSDVIPGLRPSDNAESESKSINYPTASTVERGPDITGRVPIISNVQAGMWSEIIDNFRVGDAEDWIPTTARITQNMFALRVVGDSMLNPAGFPSLPPGVIVIVDPNKAPENGSIVIARLQDSMEATIKKLVIDGGQKFLKPLNPHYPVIPINGNCTIVGVAVKVEFDL